GLADADRTISRNLRTNAPRSSASGSGTRLPSRALLVVVVLLLIGTALMFWLPQSVMDRIGASMSMGGPGSGEASAPSDSTRATAGGSIETVTPALPLQPGAGGATSTSPAATPAAPPVAAIAPVEVAPPPAAADLLVLKAREDSWISVSEAGGKPLMRRTLKAGESIKLNGNLPLAVVVGRANGIEAQVRGKPFDLAPVTGSGGVARFEVKS
ncbi:MAG: DUF4115 domain-containing protein, partial [Gammaproteobacteria bacterium]|nr:DUF4115 domain-containing protein [Gammaproteobacteria bacterium]